MRRYLWIALALCLSMGAVDVSAQGFLNKLGKAVKKEVENRVSKETKKEVEKVLGKEVKTNSSSKKTSKNQSQPASDKGQSTDNTKKGESKKSEMIRPVVVENPPKSTAPVTGKVNGHEWIDLGLPSGTRWATCNIDASQPHLPGEG